MEITSLKQRKPAASVLVVSADPVVRTRLSSALSAQRWEVREAGGGAAALLMMEEMSPQVTLLDGQLPDLHLEGFADEVRSSFPEVELISLDAAVSSQTRSPRRGELLQLLRSVSTEGEESAVRQTSAALPPTSARPHLATLAGSIAMDARMHQRPKPSSRLPELIGEAAAMLELQRRVCLVAPRATTVLIQGPTGSGKEVVARAIHRLSPRAQRPFVALNCAAIPESLLEAELFGHARGAFTGAVQRRVGRIESAQGGTLFLDEIGEMPLSLQSKLLRFLENGELQRVGENETVTVDVRVVAATHQPLSRRAQEGSFRADLFYRLAVFLVTTPALKAHPEDLPALAAHFLKRVAGGEATKQLSREAVDRLTAHSWPGNVRELQHVLERAAILAEERSLITPQEIEFDESAEPA